MNVKKFKKAAAASGLMMGTCLSGMSYASFQELDNALLHSVTPTASFLFQDIVEDTKTMTVDRLRESTVTAYRLAKNVYQGDLSEIAGTSVHLMLAKLAGRTNVDLFDNNPDFDPRTLQVCAESLTKTLMDTLMATLNKDSSRYGRVRGTGQHVDIFNNRTFLQMVTDKILPEATPLRGVFMGIANNQIMDTYVRNQIAQMALGFVTGLVQNTDMTLKESVGALVVKSFKSESQEFVSGPSSLHAPSSSNAPFVEEEVVPSYAQSFWQTLKPYVLHEMRGLTRHLLEQSLAFSINKMDQILRNSALGLSMVGGATLGGIAMGVGSSLPYVGGLFSLFGAGTSLGTFGGGALGGFTGSSFLEAVGKNTAKRMDAFSDVVVSKIIEYTPEEHALYGLNPKASDLERELFPQDYARRDALIGARTHTVVEIVRALSGAKLGQAFLTLCEGLDAEAKAAANKLWSLFERMPDLSVGTAMEQSGLSKYVDQFARAQKESRSKAYRKFTYQSKNDPDLAQAVRQYPGYDMRMAQINGFMAAPSEESRQLALQTRYVVQSLEFISWDLTAELGLDMLSSRVHDILSNLSASEQDLLVKMKESDSWRAGYGILLENLSELSKTEFTDKAIVTVLKRSIADEAERKNATYARVHAQELDQLSHLSLVDGLSQADVIALHKALSVNPGQVSSVLSTPKDLFPQDSLQVMKAYYEESLANQRGMKMYSILAETLAAQGVLDRVKKETFDRVLLLPETVDLTDLIRIVSDVITDTTEFKNLMGALRPIRDENAGSEFQKRLKSVFDARRIGLMQTLAAEVQEQVKEHYTKATSSNEEAPEIALQSSWMPALWSMRPIVSSSVPVEPKVRAEDGFEIVGASVKALDEKAIRELLSQDERHLINYDPTAFGASRLIDVMHSEAFNDPTTHGFEDLMQKVMALKKKELSTPEDQAFFDRYQEEINAFISSEDSPVKGRLWYSLQTVIDALRAKNEIFLRSVLANL